MSQIASVINKIRSTEASSLPENPFSSDSSKLECRIEDRILAYKSPFPFELPRDIQEWWTQVQSAELFVDASLKQWGLQIFDENTSFKESNYWRNERPMDILNTDIVVGSFLGDSDLLIISCDQCPTFGQVVVATPLDKRNDWYFIADSFSQFLFDYLKQDGEKYWE